MTITLHQGRCAPLLNVAASRPATQNKFDRHWFNRTRSIREAAEGAYSIGGAAR
jgi:hypothetical protein